MPRILDEPVVCHATRTCGFACTAIEAAIQMRLPGRGVLDLARMQTKHQPDAPARAVGFVGGFEIRGTRRQAQTALHAGIAGIERRFAELNRRAGARWSWFLFDLRLAARMREIKRALDQRRGFNARRVLDLRIHRLRRGCGAGFRCTAPRRGSTSDSRAHLSARRGDRAAGNIGGIVSQIVNGHLGGAIKEASRHLTICRQ